MALKRILPLLTTSLFTLSGVVQASTLLVSVSGKFDAATDSSTGSATQLWAPNGTWAISFDVNSTPVASNVTTLGFDTQFSNFTYTLNGASVGATLSSLTYSTGANGGLFTLAFGPESGVVSGSPTPDFDFYGPQAFSGTTAAPTLLTGGLPVSEWTYSDATTYDDNLSGTSTVAVTAVPEPSTALLFSLPLLSLALLRIRRFKHQK